MSSLITFNSQVNLNKTHCCWNSRRKISHRCVLAHRGAWCENTRADHLWSTGHLMKLPEVTQAQEERILICWRHQNRQTAIHWQADVLNLFCRVLLCQDLCASTRALSVAGQHCVRFQTCFKQEQMIQRLFLSAANSYFLGVFLGVPALDLGSTGTFLVMQPVCTHVVWISVLWVLSHVWIYFVSSSWNSWSISYLFEESVDLQFDLVARVVLQHRQFALCLLKLLHCRTCTWL